MKRLRQAATEGLSGEILEIGFGSGLNVDCYPDSIVKVHAIEPSLVGRRLAEPRIGQTSIEIRFDGLRGESLPLADNSCDGALCTYTLCTISGVEQALQEVLRVLKPGAPFHFLEHGSAPDENVRVWQRRFEPVQKRIADGCHLTRDPVQLVKDAGFEIERVNQRYEKGPKILTFMTVGAARKPLTTH